MPRQGQHRRRRDHDEGGGQQALRPKTHHANAHPNQRQRHRPQHRRQPVLRSRPHRVPQARPCQSGQHIAHHRNEQSGGDTGPKILRRQTWLQPTPDHPQGGQQQTGCAQHPQSIGPEAVTLVHHPHRGQQDQRGRQRRHKHMPQWVPSIGQQGRRVTQQPPQLAQQQQGQHPGRQHPQPQRHLQRHRPPMGHSPRPGQRQTTQAHDHGKPGKTQVLHGGGGSLFGHGQ